MYDACIKVDPAILRHGISMCLDPPINITLFSHLTD